MPISNMDGSYEYRQISCQVWCGCIAVSLCSIFILYFKAGGYIYDMLFAWFYCKISAEVLQREKRKLFRVVKEHHENLMTGLSLLEIGSGPASNMSFYPPNTKLVCLEPNKFFAKEIEDNAKETGCVQSLEIVRGYAERMPFQDDTFDIVVCTLVLCTVQDIKKALSEIKRVLKPGGKLVFLEHVPTSHPWIYPLQVAIIPLNWFIFGCYFNRDIVKYLKISGFSDLGLETFQPDGLPFFCFALHTCIT